MLRNLALMQQIRKNLFLLAPLIVYWVLISPFLGSIPYLDGNIDFVKTSDLYTGGIQRLFANWRSIHPPLKELLTILFYKFFGVTSFSYTLVGMIFGSLGIIYFYLLCKKLIGNSVAKTATFLLAACPLYLSIGIFALTDFLLTISILISLYYYTEKKFLNYSIFASMAFLAKETGLILAFSVLIVEIISAIKKRYIKSLLSILPFFTAVIWSLLLKLNQKPLWSDWNFSETADKGSLYTIFYNLVSFNFLNKYAYQNWLHLFVLNFNWVFWILTLLGILLFLRKNKLTIFKLTSGLKTFYVIFIFNFVYIISVLSFQTYTIPRYVLPVIPFLLIGTSFCLETITKKSSALKIYLSVPLVIFVVIRLFMSADPISSLLWGKTNILGENMYSIHRHLAGNDGITYNMQYAQIVKKRTEKILLADKGTGIVLSDECHWIFPDPNNDNKTIEILKIDLNVKKPCSKP